MNKQQRIDFLKKRFENMNMQFNEMMLDDMDKNIIFASNSFKISYIEILEAVIQIILHGGNIDERNIRKMVGKNKRRNK